MATIFAAFGKTLGNNKGTFQNFGIVGVTFATEEIGNFIFFYCPCDYPRNKMYGSTFIWGPAIVLLIIGYLANRRTWRLTTGLCYRSFTLRKGRQRAIHFIYTFASIGVKALIAPATWIALAFLKGDYYACGHWPNPFANTNETRKYFQLEESKGNIAKPCYFNPNPAKFLRNDEAEIIARSLRAESHVIGWMFLTIGMLVAVIVMFISRCYSNFSYEQGNYIDRYRAHEIELFEAKMDERSKELAQHIVDGYFSKTRAKEDWEKIAVINDKVTKSKDGKAIYSPLHRFVNKEVSKMVEKQPQNQMLMAVKDSIVKANFVQDAATKRKAKIKLDNKQELKYINQTKTTEKANAVQPILMHSIAANPPKQTVQVNTNTNPIQTNPSNLTEHQAIKAEVEDKAKISAGLEVSAIEPSKLSLAGSKATQMHETPSAENEPSGSALSQGLASNVSEVSKCKNQTYVDKERPISLVSESGTIKETSLGDFGGFYSREDLSTRCEEVDGAQEIPEELTTGDVHSDNDHVRFNNSEEAPLIEKEQL